MTGRFAGSYQCASCKGENHKCLIYNPTVDLESPDIETIEGIDSSNWRRAVDKWKKRFPEMEGYPEYAILQYFDLCPIPLFNPTELLIFDFWRAKKGNPFGELSFAEYLKIPARLLDYMRQLEIAINEGEEFRRLANGE